MFVPVEIGETCPLNETEWMKRKALFNCTDTSGNPPKEYHCVTNNLEVPGEVCMGSGWVQPNYCPVFHLNTKGFDATPCDPQRGICPSQQFQTRDVFKYWELQTCSYSYGYFYSDEGCCQDPGCLNFTRQPDVVQNGDMKPEPTNFLPLIAGIGVAVATLVVIGICCVWYCKRKSGGSGWLDLSRVIDCFISTNKNKNRSSLGHKQKAGEYENGMKEIIAMKKKRLELEERKVKALERIASALEGHQEQSYTELSVPPSTGEDGYCPLSMPL